MARRLAGWLLALSLAAGAVAAAAVAGDWLARIMTAEALLDQVERSEAAMLAAMAVVQDNESPNGGGELQQAASSARVEIAAAATTLRRLPVQPWHGQLESARTSYLAHTDAWLEFLERAAADPAEWFQNDPEIERTWLETRQRLRDMLPIPASPGLSDRVARIVDSDPEDQAGPTLQARGISGGRPG